MITFARELLCEVVQEVQPLLELHYDEVVRHKEVVKLDPQWDQYLLLERLERFVILTAREDGKLIGYAAFHVIRLLQDAGFTQAMNDAFFVKPGHRDGMMVLRFLRYCADQLKSCGAQQVAYLTSPHNNLAALLHRLGYEDEQVMTAKIL